MNNVPVKNYQRLKKKPPAKEIWISVPRICITSRSPLSQDDSGREPVQDDSGPPDYQQEGPYARRPSFEHVQIRVSHEHGHERCYAARFDAFEQFGGSALLSVSQISSDPAKLR